ncbi:VTT domain-containing protein [Aquisalimonas asiatica]|uniref:Uncharacterized membrane protein YdjX, TVP38/TMEM64 family, SNARE-associated domain n=1 Tax=Aquisalimonas asiatica TaxID=406100 RepID=A0A1H8UNV5_9GAMM|nr:VTT domain-containing protein [Aquisalimonas asiatica]SEP04895.1 Uncharacterized membrane protein YdjX, TVP38/TMEM64 family, SNARE-associated domain [Aquisalimonas asiatica]
MSHWRVMALLGLLIAGPALALWEPMSLRELMELGQDYARKPWVGAGSVLLLAVMLTLALPGSLVFWLIAPFHPPAVAVPMLLAGSVPGCIGAYWVAATLGDRLRHARRTAGIVDFMRERSDTMSQCALRVLPGFPHAVVNYTAGVLRLRLTGFIIAAIIGLGIKWSLYSAAVYGSVESVRRGEGIDGGTMLLMGAIAALMVTAAWLKRRMARD